MKSKWTLYVFAGKTYYDWHNPALDLVWLYGTQGKDWLGHMLPLGFVWEHKN